jgi:hypothetical protein
MPECRHVKFKFWCYLPERKEFPKRAIRVYKCPCGALLDDATADRRLQPHVSEPGEESYLPPHRRTENQGLTLV